MDRLDSDANQHITERVNTLHAFIWGRVQGVNFRYYTRQKALDLNLLGWVRNLADGRVETIAVGSPEALQVFENFLAVGPPAASVTDVTVTYGVETGSFESFSIRYD